MLFTDTFLHAYFLEKIMLIQMNFPLFFNITILRLSKLNIHISTICQCMYPPLLFVLCEFLLKKIISAFQIKLK